MKSITLSCIIFLLASNRLIRAEAIAVLAGAYGDVLIKRIRYNKKRPKAAELTLQELRKLIVSRSKIYIKADFKINCDKLDKFQITKNILEFYEK